MTFAFSRSSEAAGEASKRLGELVVSKEILVVCGPGGVGKTTTAASLAAAAALKEGSRVLVLTIDPAKRLAGALGVEGLGNVARQVPSAEIDKHSRGQLWAAMLDTKQSWDALVFRHAPNAETAKRILENPLYQNVSSRFVHGHDYMAVERLYELHTEGAYDLVVVDTPPSRNALDLLDAPRRMADFFQSRLLRLLIVPYRSRMVGLASRPFYQLADRVLGSQLLGDIAEFFILFQTMYSGFVERAKAVERLLMDDRTSFVVVTTPEAGPLREAQRFASVLKNRKLDFGGLIVNRILPSYLLDEEAGIRAAALREEAAEITNDLREIVDLDDLGEETFVGVLREVAENFLNLSAVAKREAAQRAHAVAGMDPAPPAIVSLPEMHSDVNDVRALLRLGEHIW